MLLNKTLNESVGNKPLFAYCTLGRMVFSFHHAFFSKNFWVHPGLNELHMMFPGSREKLPFFISLLGLDNRSIAVCKHIPYHSPLSPRPYLHLQTSVLLLPWPTSASFPTWVASRKGAISAPFRSGWSEHMKEVEGSLPLYYSVTPRLRKYILYVL